MSILVVDDDHDLIDLMTFALRRAGFNVRYALDGATAVSEIEREMPELIVLDIHLDDWNGIDILRGLRGHSRVPVILLTQLTGEEATVEGLEAGADDYVAKPFSFRELTARIRALLRRAQPDWVAPTPGKPAVLSAGGIEVNTAEHTCTRNGQPLHLTNTEFRMLAHLMTHAGAVVEHRVLMMEIWGFDDAGARDSVRVTLRRLRTKIEENPSRPRFLHTIPGVGVMFRPT